MSCFVLHCSWFGNLGDDARFLTIAQIKQPLRRSLSQFILVGQDDVCVAEGCAGVPVKAKEHLQKERAGITFAVDAVKPAEKPIWTERLGASLEKRFQRKVLLLPDAHLQVINSSVDSLRENRSLKEPQRTQLIERVCSRCHPLIDALHDAFAQHRPLVLSPDDIWLVIAQGFSHHVAENAETLRGRLVRHEGKQTLTAKARDFTLTSFESAIAGFSSQIRLAIDPVLHETLIAIFRPLTPQSARPAKWS